MTDLTFRAVLEDQASGPARQIASALGEIGKSAEGGGGLLGKLREGLVGLAEPLTSINGLKEGLSSCVEASGHLAESVKTLQDRFGGTAEDASHLREIFQLGGADPDKAVTALGRLSKGLESTTGKPTATAKELSQLGVSFTDAQGKILPMTDLLPKIADKFQAMPDGANKTALAMQLFGKQGADLIPLLDMGSAGMAKLTQEGDKLGLTLGEKNIDDIHKNMLAHKEFQAALQGVQVTIGNLLMPVLTQLMEWAAKGALAFTSVVIPAIKSFGELLIGTLVPKIGELVQQVLPMFLKWFTDIGNWFKTVIWPIFLLFADLLYQRLLVYLKDLRDNILPQLMKWFTDIGNWIKGTLLPAFQDLATTISDKLKAPLQDVISFLSSHQEIFAALAAAIALVAAGMAAFAVATGVATAAATVFGAAIAVITSPVTLVVAAIALLVLGIIELSKHWDEINQKVPQLGEAWTKVQQVFSQFTDWLKSTFIPQSTAALDGLKTGVSDVISFISEHWHQIQDIIVPVLDIIKQAFITIFTDITGYIHAQLDIIVGIFKVAMDLIHGNWSQAWDDLKSMIVNVFNDIKGIVQSNLDLVTQIFSAAWDGIKAASADVWSAISGHVQDGISGIVNWLRSNWQEVLLDLLFGPIYAFRDQIAGVLSDVGGKLGEGLDQLKNVVTGWGNDARTWLVNAGEQIIQGLIDGFTNRLNDVKNTLGDLKDKITSWKGPLEEDRLLLVPAGQAIIGGLKASLESGYGAIQSSLQTFTKSLAAGALRGVNQTSGSGGGYGQQLTGEQIAALILQAGGTPEEASIGAQIALRESGGWTQIPALTPGDPYRGQWGGLFQFIPPTAAAVGLPQGADPLTQAAAFLKLFRMNGGSDWTGGGQYPLPAPGPYLSGASLAGVDLSGSNAASKATGKASAPATEQVWYAFGYSGWGTPPPAPKGFKWVASPNGMQTLQQELPPLENYQQTGNAQGLTFQRVWRATMPRGMTPGIAGGAAAVGTGEWVWELVDASTQTATNTKKAADNTGESGLIGTLKAVGKSLQTPIEAFGHALEAIAAGPQSLVDRFANQPGWTPPPPVGGGLSGGGLDPVAAAVQAVGDKQAAQASTRWGQAQQQQLQQQATLTASAATLTRIQNALTPIEHQIDLGNQDVKALLPVLQQFANDPKTPAELKAELGNIGYGIQEGTLNLSQVKQNLANLGDPTNQIRANTASTAANTASTAANTAATAKNTSPQTTGQPGDLTPLQLQAEGLLFHPTGGSLSARQLAWIQGVMTGQITGGSGPGGSIPSFAGGGVMPWTGLAYLHAGETVSRGAGGGPIQFVIQTLDPQNLRSSLPGLLREADLHLKRLGLPGLSPGTNIP